MILKNAHPGKEYIIKAILTDDADLDKFLFSLGCFEGQPITVINKLSSGCTISVKDGRYNIDRNLAEAIVV